MNSAVNENQSAGMDLVRNKRMDVFGKVVGYPPSPSPDTNHSSIPHLCNWSEQNLHPDTSSRDMGALANLGIYAGIFVLCVLAFFGLQKLAKSGKCTWVKKIYSDGLFNGGKPLASTFLHYCRKVWDVSIDHSEELGWDGRCYLFLYKLVILLTTGIGFLSMFLLIANTIGAARFTTPDGNSTDSMYFANLNATASNTDLVHSSFNLVSFLGVLVVFLVSFIIEDRNEITSSGKTKMLMIWDIQEWATKEKDPLKWIKDLFPRSQSIHFRSKETGKMAKVVKWSKDLAIMIEFRTNEEAQSSYDDHIKRAYLKLRLISAMSIDDVLIENYLYRIDNHWILVLIYITSILGIVVLNTVLVVLVTYASYGYTGGFVYQSIRFVIPWLIEKIFNAIPNLLYPGTRTQRHVGCLLTTVASTWAVNLFLPMLLLDDGADIYNWINTGVETIKVNQSTFRFLDRIQCMFRPSLNSQWNNSIGSTLVTGSAFSLLRLSIIVDCIWFPMKNKLKKVWNKISKKQNEQIDADAVKWNDSIEFDLGTKYGSLINIFTMTVVAGTILTPVMVYPTSLTVLIIRYFVDKHDLIHTFKPSATDPVVHQMAIGFSFLPFFVTSIALVCYNYWRNTKNGQVISMGSTVVSYGSCVILMLVVFIFHSYISYRYLFAEGQHKKKTAVQTIV